MGSGEGEGGAVRRTGLTLEQVEASEDLILELVPGLIWTRWRLKETLQGNCVIALEPAPGCTNREVLLATGLSLSPNNARIRAIEWLAFNRRSAGQENEDDGSTTESVKELLRRPDL